VRLSRISFSTDHEPPLEEREQLYCAVMAALGLDPDEWRHREIDEDMKRRMTKAMEGHRIQVMLSELRGRLETPAAGLETGKIRRI
jgi:hypothetical protein